MYLWWPQLILTHLIVLLINVTCYSSPHAAPQENNNVHHIIIIVINHVIRPTLTLLHNSALLHNLTLLKQFA